MPQAGAPLAPPSVSSGANPRAGEPSNYQLFKWMMTFAWPVKGLAAAVCLLVALTTGIDVLAVDQTGRAINQIQALHFGELSAVGGFWAWFSGPQPEARGLRTVILVLAGLLVLQSIFRYLRETTHKRMSMDMVFVLREAVYDKLQHVGFRFHDKISTGQLINRALTDLQNVRSFVETAVITTLDILLTVVFFTILLLTKSAWVAALALAPLPIWAFYILRFGRKVQPMSEAIMKAGDRDVSIITENIAGVHVVKAFATQSQEVAKYKRNADLYMLRVMRRIRAFANFTPIIRSIATISHLTLFLLAGILIIKGEMLVGDFIVLGSAMGSILSKLQGVSVINEQYQAAIVSARRLHEVLHAAPTVNERPGAKLLPRGYGASIKFEHVTFGYDPARPVLHDVSFEIPAGTVAAIVGPTGAGKSTLVALLARFYDPQQGRILVDGIDLRDLNLASLRSAVSYVFQETYLFSETVENNISYGRPGIRGGEVEAAARLAQAHEFIAEMPQGYQTPLGERGMSLSGGQRQRMAIARAILFNPRILVLDDATAAVDPGTDDLIRRGMRFVMQGLTTVVIAHRISTVKEADQVIVLENGQVTQTGRHEDLMQEDGHYRDIAAAQLGGPQPGEDAPSHMDRMRRDRAAGRDGHDDGRAGDAPDAHAGRNREEM